MNTATTPIETQLNDFSQLLQDDSNNNTTENPERLDRRSPRPEKVDLLEQYRIRERFARFFGSQGLLVLHVAQITTIALVVFALLPLLISSFQGQQYNRVQSGSMEPNLAVGDIVITKPFVKSSFSVGDVIGINYEGTRYIHEVVAVAEDGTATTKGQANNTTDSFHPSPNQKDVWGHYESVVKQPLATSMTLFAINLDWWTPAWANISSGDWVSMAESSDGAPWGFFGLLAAIILVWYIVPELIDRSRARAARRAAEDLIILTQIVDEHDDSITEIEPVIEEIKADRAADLEAKTTAEDSYWNAFSKADPATLYDDEAMPELVPEINRPINVFSPRPTPARPPATAFDLGND